MVGAELVHGCQINGPMEMPQPTNRSLSNFNENSSEMTLSNVVVLFK